jgi:hypothetical protein
MADDNPRNIRDAIKSWCPNWLLRNQGFRWIFGMALSADFFSEAMFDGVLAPLPSQGTPTALPLIGQSRGIVQGLLESDDAYAARLVSWLTTWESAGSAETLVGLIQGFLGNNLVVRLLDRHGNFVTANADGTISLDSDPTWNWDGSAVPSTANNWSDMWMVVYVTDGRFPITSTAFTDPAWTSAWGNNEGGGLGHQVPRVMVDGMYRIIANFKGAHTYLQAIIFTNDTTQFVPGSLGSIPDGHYAGWSKRDGSNDQVPARTTDLGGGKYIRYWTPLTGG